MEQLYSMPGYRVYEYQLVLSPHEELCRRIVKLRSEFAEKYRVAAPPRIRPHVWIATFHNTGMMEDRIMQRLQAISMGLRPFRVDIRDFGSYPAHTIYLNVVSRPQILSVVRELKKIQRLLKLNPDIRPHFADEPHISVCRGLKPWQYEQGWKEYSHRHFTAKFMASGILLLKRPEGSKKTFQVLRRFEFLDLPVATRQGELFA